MNYSFSFTYNKNFLKRTHAQYILYSTSYNLVFLLLAGITSIPNLIIAHKSSDFIFTIGTLLLALFLFILYRNNTSQAINTLYNPDDQDMTAEIKLQDNLLEYKIITHDNTMQDTPVALSKITDISTSGIVLFLVNDQEIYPMPAQAVGSKAEQKQFLQDIKTIVKNKPMPPIRILYKMFSIVLLTVSLLNILNIITLIQK